MQSRRLSNGTAAFYAQYIGCLNDRAWKELGTFVAEDVIHNGRPLGLEGYRAMLEGNYRDIPDLHFQIDRLVANETQLAVRLRFRCTPIGKFLGIPVNGRRVLFHEHAFYTLNDAKIADVSSVIDKAAIEAQVT